MGTHLLGRGIYDLGEVARLVRRSPDEVAGWAVPTAAHGALLRPHDRRLFSFYDLVTAVIADQMRTRGVSLTTLRSARDYLAADFGSDWPLANAVALGRIATAGRDLYVRDGEAWVDAGRGGQRPFQEVVGPFLDTITFGERDMAALWRPAEGVVVDPQVQAGAPCIEGTRLATDFVAGLVASGERPEDVALDYDLSPEVVRRAVAYEDALAA